VVASKARYALRKDAQVQLIDKRDAPSKAVGMGTSKQLKRERGYSVVEQLFK
jgi:hypothetical protein